MTTHCILKAGFFFNLSSETTAELELQAKDLLFRSRTTIALFRDQTGAAILLDLIGKRELGFREAIWETDNKALKGAYTRALLNFARTLHACVTNPALYKNWEEEYFASSDYINAGGHKNSSTHTPKDDMAILIMTFGIMAVISSCVCFGLIFPISGCTILAIGLTLAIPAGFYVLTQTLPSQLAIAQEETELFNAAGSVCPR